MMLFKIAFRNILRNSRRSLMTASAIAVGAIAMILFGEYVAFIMVGLETGAVENGGHLTVYRKGYFDFGSGNPSAYSIDKYQSVMRLIENDPELKSEVTVVTPNVTLFGIAGNFAIDSSKTFFGSGFVASDRRKMRQWNEYGIQRLNRADDIGTRDDDETHGIVGIGLARVLGLCQPLKIANCPSPPKPKVSAVADAPALDVNLTELSARDRETVKVPPADKAPRIDLLAATAEGAPNVVSFFVNKAMNMGFKELDDAYVGMNLKLAQQLLYGRGEHKAVSIEVQLRRTEDMEKAHARLDALFKERGLDLEVHDFKELTPQYNQIISFMGAIFTFISVIMGVIVLFTIVNTMSMSVMERTNEIGTARAMGVRRSGIRRQFLIEGWMLGAIGATAGVILASLLATWFNHAGIMYTPPGQAHPVPLVVLTHGVEKLLLSVWFGLMLMATIAAIIPAGRAARMLVVDALRHV
ncbi:MAG: ABC transporter permease [Alphaproteobacteria bacterium]|nr:ABC transporter permease [Alphaproteobacteria bacterium]